MDYNAIAKSLLLCLCAFTFIFFAFVSKKILKKVLQLKNFIYLRNQIPILLKQS